MNPVKIDTPIANLAAARYRLFWRMHFYAGVFTAPIIVWAALTGILYALSPQIEAWRHRDVDVVAVQGAVQTLDAQVLAAQSMFPHQHLNKVIPAVQPGTTTQVFFDAPSAEHLHHRAGPVRVEHSHEALPNATIAYVNPYTAQVVGSLDEMQRFKVWAKKLHSSFLLGDSYRWPIELGASWMVVMLLTGIYLWWSSGQLGADKTHGVWKPRLHHGGRIAWRDLHAMLGILMAGILVVMMVTGLTWSKYSGKVFKVTRDAIGQNSPQAPRDLQFTLNADAASLNWAEIAHIIADEMPPIQYQMFPPDSTQPLWRIDSIDLRQPGQRFSLLLHPQTGAVLYRSGWNALSAVGKATALGIPFHRGEFGLWNQILVAMAGCSAIFSVVSGFVMWWKRRPKKVPSNLKSSIKPHIKASARIVPLWIWPLILLAVIAMPLFGASLLVALIVDGLARSLRFFLKAKSFR